MQCIISVQFIVRFRTRWTAQNFDSHCYIRIFACVMDKKTGHESIFNNLFAAVVAISSCEKGGTVAPGFFGKYELRRQYGGLYYRDSTYKAGNGTVYQFNSDSTYKLVYSRGN